AFLKLRTTISSAVLSLPINVTSSWSSRCILRKNRVLCSECKGKHTLHLTVIPPPMEQVGRKDTPMQEMRIAKGEVLLKWLYIPLSFAIYGISFHIGTHQYAIEPIIESRHLKLVISS